MEEKKTSIRSKKQRNNPAGPQSNKLRKLRVDHADLSESQNFHQNPCVGFWFISLSLKLGIFLIKGKPLPFQTQ